MDRIWSSVESFLNHCSGTHQLEIQDSHSAALRRLFKDPKKVSDLKRIHYKLEKDLTNMTPLPPSTSNAQRIKQRKKLFLTQVENLSRQDPVKSSPPDRIPREEPPVFASRPSFSRGESFAPTSFASPSTSSLSSSSSFSLPASKKTSSSNPKSSELASSSNSTRSSSFSRSPPFSSPHSKSCADPGTPPWLKTPPKRNRTLDQSETESEVDSPEKRLRLINRTGVGRTSRDASPCRQVDTEDQEESADLWLKLGSLDVEAEVQDWAEAESSIDAALNEAEDSKEEKESGAMIQSQPANIDPPKDDQGGQNPASQAFNVIADPGVRLKIMRAQSDGRKCVPFGTQFYLSALVTNGHISWDDLNITSGINAIRAESNLESMRNLFKQDIQHSIWEESSSKGIISRELLAQEAEIYHELDRESEALKRDRFSGLGFTEGSPDGSKQYGGNVIFEGKISTMTPKRATKLREFEISLYPPRLGQSCRFTRRYGSERFLRLKLDQAFLRDAQNHSVGWEKRREVQEELKAFLLRPFLLLGRIYKLLHTKSDTIWLLQVDERSNQPFAPLSPSLDWRTKPLSASTSISTSSSSCSTFLSSSSSPPFSSSSSNPSSSHPLEIRTIWDFVDKHGPFELNTSSLMLKYLQRLTLGFLTSFPAAVVDKIKVEEDLYGERLVVGEGESAKGREERKMMTDGAAPASHSIMKAIAESLDSHVIPSAFQARVCGAKGVWFLDPTTRAELSDTARQAPRTITVRPSQLKLESGAFEKVDPSQRIIDLLTPARTYHPCTLSKQIIMLLANNGVPVSVFQEIQRKQLEQILEDFSNWEGPEWAVRHRLTVAIESHCNVEAGKIKRSMSDSEARAQGYFSRVEEDARGERQRDAEFESEKDLFFTVQGRHKWNSMPLSKANCACEMLLAGFHPQRCYYLADLLQSIAKNSIEKVVRRFSLPISKSAEAICIPDPVGVLEPDEIQFRFGDPVTDEETKLRLWHVPEGDVLVTRHPCLLPTDIRKVKSVLRSELKDYHHVVVFSVKGQRPLADLLSGGDYDGDTVRVFWGQDLVGPFENQPLRFTESPFKISDVFHKSELTVQDFLEANRDKDPSSRDQSLIELLIKPIFSYELKGILGNMHLCASYRWGCESKEAVELAHKFNQCMDGPKTGLEMKPEIRKQDTKKFHFKLPEWGEKETVLTRWKKENPFSHSTIETLQPIKRDPKLPVSVLDCLWKSGLEEQVRLGRIFREKLESSGSCSSGMEGSQGEEEEDTDLSHPWREAISKGRLQPWVKRYIVNHVEECFRIYKETNLHILRSHDLGDDLGGRGGRNGESFGRETRRSKSPFKKWFSMPERPSLVGEEGEEGEEDEEIAFLELWCKSTELQNQRKAPSATSETPTASEKKATTCFSRTKSSLDPFLPSTSGWDHEGEDEEALLPVTKKPPVQHHRHQKVKFMETIAEVGQLFSSFPPITLGGAQDPKVENPLWIPPSNSTETITIHPETSLTRLELEDLALLRASYAYVHSLARKRSKFFFQLAYRWALELKTRGLSQPSPPAWIGLPYQSFDIMRVRRKVVVGWQA
ncbi:hypothetical protein IE53DRAFT_28075 [Violaceomyces palustris]|uniref:Uncharacterized protein n=1 Tax=Violaceomyces palustris TaxID=1673888 RepID=A0ACD0P1F9_9BASI|nr:hypothetical protein IE53DRAFT_28075 [Violaceomyces palustris]